MSTVALRLAGDAAAAAAAMAACRSLRPSVGGRPLPLSVSCDPIRGEREAASLCRSGALLVCFSATRAMSFEAALSLIDSLPSAGLSAVPHLLVATSAAAMPVVSMTAEMCRAAHLRGVPIVALPPSSAAKAEAAVVACVFWAALRRPIIAPSHSAPLPSGALTALAAAAVAAGPVAWFPAPGLASIISSVADAEDRGEDVAGEIESLLASAAGMPVAPRDHAGREAAAFAAASAGAAAASAAAVTARLPLGAAAAAAAAEAPVSRWTSECTLDEWMRLGGAAAPAIVFLASAGAAARESMQDAAGLVARVAGAPDVPVVGAVSVRLGVLRHPLHMSPWLLCASGTHETVSQLVASKRRVVVVHVLSEGEDVVDAAERIRRQSFSLCGAPEMVVGQCASHSAERAVAHSEVSAMLGMPGVLLPRKDLLSGRKVLFVCLRLLAQSVRPPPRAVLVALLASADALWSSSHGADVGLQPPFFRVALVSTARSAQAATAFSGVFCSRQLFEVNRMAFQGKAVHESPWRERQSSAAGLPPCEEDSAEVPFLGARVRVIMWNTRWARYMPPALKSIAHGLVGVVKAEEDLHELTPALRSAHAAGLPCMVAVVCGSPAAEVAGDAAAAAKVLQSARSLFMGGGIPSLAFRPWHPHANGVDEIVQALLYRGHSAARGGGFVFKACQALNDGGSSEQQSSDKCVVQ
jgi:hypothetical protein